MRGRKIIDIKSAPNLFKEELEKVKIMVFCDEKN